VAAFTGFADFAELTLDRANIACGGHCSQCFIGSGSIKRA
jgi:hypothetical protein